MFQLFKWFNMDEISNQAISTTRDFIFLFKWFVSTNVGEQLVAHVV